MHGTPNRTLRTLNPNSRLKHLHSTADRRVKGLIALGFSFLELRVLGLRRALVRIEAFGDLQIEIWDVGLKF